MHKLALQGPLTNFQAQTKVLKGIFLIIEDKRILRQTHYILHSNAQLSRSVLLKADQEMHLECVTFRLKLATLQLAGLNSERSV